MEYQSTISFECKPEHFNRPCLKDDDLHFDLVFIFWLQETNLKK